MEVTITPRGCIQDVEWRTTKYTLCKAWFYLLVFVWMVCLELHVLYISHQSAAGVDGLSIWYTFYMPPYACLDKSNEFPRRIAHYDASIKSPR